MLICILKGRHHETQTSGAEISHFYFLQYILQNCHFYTMKKKTFLHQLRVRYRSMA